MYKVEIIVADKRQAIHLPNNSSINLYTASIKNELNLASGFTFSFLPNNPGWGLVNPYTTTIEVTDLQKNIVIFYGRVTDVTNAMTNDGVLLRTATAESELGYLKDSYQTFEEIHNMTPKDFFIKIINQHNKQVVSDRRFLIGNIDVTNSTDNVYRFLDYQNSYQAIMDKLVTRLGGYISIRHTNGGRYIDYLESSGKQSAMSIELAKNMLSLTDVTKMSELITRLVPLGQTITDTSTSESNVNKGQPKLTIKSVNNNVEYLVDTELEKKLGAIIYGTNEWSDVTKAENLLTKGKTWLAQQKIPNSVTVSALDLSTINDKFERYVFGNTYTIKHQILGVESKHILTAQTINLLQPEQSDLTFGDLNMTLTQYQHAQNLKNEANKYVASMVTMTSNQLKKLQDAFKNADVEGIQKTLTEILTVSNNQGKIIDLNTVDIAAIKELNVEQKALNIEQGQLNADYEKRISALEKGGK